MNLDKLLSKIYHKYGENPGGMLLHTVTIGWVLSCAAQICAIVFNKKIDQEQKNFLIPQEIGDGLVNILSFYILTSSIKGLASKSVINGKIINKKIKGYLKKHNLISKIGKSDFNIKKTANYSEIKDEFIAFKNGVEVTANIVGSIISCNIVTPIIRNEIATKRQSKANAKIYQSEQKLNAYHKTSMNNFINNSVGRI